MVLCYVLSDSSISRKLDFVLQYLLCIGNCVSFDKSISWKLHGRTAPYFTLVIYSGMCSSLFHTSPGSVTETELKKKRCRFSRNRKKSNENRRKTDFGFGFCHILHNKTNPHENQSICIKYWSTQSIDSNFH